jgi:hypothetical protein
MNRQTAVDIPPVIVKATPGLGARLVWFALIWLCSVAALGAVAMVIRWAIKA